MNILDIEHPELSGGETRLTAEVSAAAASSTVENNAGFSANDYIVFGKLGEEKTEVVKISTVSGNTTINHDALVFDHSARTVVVEIPYNQIEIYTATSETGSYSLLATINITPDSDFTTYPHSAGDTTTWYKTRYKNSQAGTYSDYSPVVQGTGYIEQSLYDMTDEILEEYGDPLSHEVSRKRVRTVLRAGVRKITLELIKTFPDYNRQHTTQALTSTVSTYNLPTRFLTFIRVDVNYDSTDYSSAYKVDSFESEAEGEPYTTYQKTDPRVFIRGDQFGLRPTPDSSSGMAWLWYWEAPSSMVNSSDEHGLPYGAREPLVSYSLYRLWKNKNIDIANTYRSQYKDDLGDYIDFVAQSRQNYKAKKVKITHGADLYTFDV